MPVVSVLNRLKNLIEAAGQETVICGAAKVEKLRQCLKRWNIFF